MWCPSVVSTDGGGARRSLRLSVISADIDLSKIDEQIEAELAADGITEDGDRIEALQMNMLLAADEVTQILREDHGRAFFCKFHYGKPKLPTRCPSCALAAQQDIVRANKRGRA